MSSNCVKANGNGQGSGSPQAVGSWPDLWRERGAVVGGVLLFALVLGTFLPAINNGFVGYDDPVYVTANRPVQAGLSWEGVRWAFSSFAAANWHPLTWLSHMADCQFFGLQPWGHHLTSILLHALNTGLLFAALRRLTGATGRSLVVALLFGLHPLRVESIAWIAERKDVLSTSFFMLTLWAYARYVAESKVQSPKSKVQSQKSGERSPKEGRNPKSEVTADAPDTTPHARGWYSVALGCFCLGLMCKPMLVTVPCVLLLLDYWPLDRIGIENQKSKIKNLLFEKLPFFGAALVVSGITMLAQGQGGAMETAVPFVTRAENALVAYGRYLGKLIWPADLACFYPPVAHWPAMRVLGGAALLLAISVAALRLRRRHPYLLTGWLWFAGTLVPVIGLVQAGEQSMADRYSYVPSVGILLMVVWGVSEAASRGRFRTAALAAATAAAAMLCSGVTWRQISYWKDTETLCRHALLVIQSNYVAHNNLGTALEQQGRLDEAIGQYQQALAERPGYVQARKNLGVALEHQGHPEAAIRQLEQALALRPADPEAHKNLATVLDRQGRLGEAMGHYRTALSLSPDYADAHFNLGLDCVRTGRMEEAVREFQETVRLQPDLPDGHNNLGMALDQTGRTDEAISHYRQALALKPDYARAHFNLGVACSRKGRLDEAIAEFQRALALQPDYAAAQSNLASLLELKRSR